MPDGSKKGENRVQNLPQMPSKGHATTRAFSCVLNVFMRKQCLSAQALSIESLDVELEVCYKSRQRNSIGPAGS